MDKDTNFNVSNYNEQDNQHREYFNNVVRPEIEHREFMRSEVYQQNID